MTYQLKTISRQAIPEATAKADWYRLLNEPGEAESICRDVLAVDPGDQTALRLLGLAITDQFTGAASDRRAECSAKVQRLMPVTHRGLARRARANGRNRTMAARALNRS